MIKRALESGDSNEDIIRGYAIDYEDEDEMSNSSEDRETWQVRWNDWLQQWEVFLPSAYVSEEGTQAYQEICLTHSRIVADRIIADHEQAQRLEQAIEALLRQCKGCRDDEKTLANYSDSGHAVHSSGWICPYTPSERVLIAQLRPPAGG